jgi:2-oxoglutarate ferredoxin oxidoreductase subunit alpha
MERLSLKWQTAATLVPQALISSKGYKAGIIFYGTSALPMQEALDLLAEKNIHVNALRVRGFPFADEVADFVASHPWVFVIEQNRDAQLKTLMVTDGKINPSRLISVLHYDGTPITARFIVDQISQHAGARSVVPLKKAS